MLWLYVDIDVTVATSISFFLEYILYEAGVNELFYATNNIMPRQLFNEKPIHSNTHNHSSHKPSILIQTTR